MDGYPMLRGEVLLPVKLRDESSLPGKWEHWVPLVLLLFPGSKLPFLRFPVSELPSRIFGRWVPDTIAPYRAAVATGSLSQVSYNEVRKIPGLGSNCL